MMKTAMFALLVSIIAATFAISPAYSQSTIVAAPTVVDPTLTPGSAFSVDITIQEVTGMLGYGFRLTYDPTVLMATGFMSNVPFTQAWPSGITDGHVDVAYTMPIPEYTGVDLYSGDPAYPMATIDFTVLDYGVSGLDLSMVVIADVFGGATVPMVNNGVFSNIPTTGVAVVFNAYLLSSRKLPAGGIQTATEQVENIGMWTTKAKVRFVVVDLGGAVVATSEVIGVVMPGEVLRVSADFDTTGWELGDYRVRYTLEYLTFDGAAGVWTQGAHGGLDGQTIKYKTFTLQ